MNNEGNNFKQINNYTKDKNMNELFFQNNDVVFIDDQSQNINLNNNKDNQNINNNNNFPVALDNNVRLKEENTFMKFILGLNNKKVMIWIFILIFIFVTISVGKIFYLSNKVDDYEEFYTEIEEKLSKDVIIYEDENKVENNLKNTAAEELVNCINSSVDINDLPDSITSVIEEINNYYNQSNNYFAFKYKDIYTGFSVSYNENQNIFTASTIKAAKDIYIYEMASLGKVNLDDSLVYTSSYANTGAWELKKKAFNTKHTIRDLLKYSTVASDNAAHNMLMDHFGRNNMLSFWKEKGTTAIFTADNNWGITNAHDATIYMDELYKFYIEDTKYGQEIMNNFLDSYPKFIKGKNDYKIASKSGWAGSAIHDVSIIFADNPYIVVALSNLGDTGHYMGYFDKVNDLADKLHTEYWKYKIDKCSNINQY